MDAGTLVGTNVHQIVDKRGCNCLISLCKRVMHHFNVDEKCENAHASPGHSLLLLLLSSPGYYLPHMWNICLNEHALYLRYAETRHCGNADGRLICLRNSRILSALAVLKHLPTSLQKARPSFRLPELRFIVISQLIGWSRASGSVYF